MFCAFPNRRLLLFESKRSPRPNDPDRSCPPAPDGLPMEMMKFENSQAEPFHLATAGTYRSSFRLCRSPENASSCRSLLPGRLKQGLPERFPGKRNTPALPCPHRPKGLQNQEIFWARRSGMSECKGSAAPVEYKDKNAPVCARTAAFVGPYAVTTYGV